MLEFLFLSTKHYKLYLIYKKGGSQRLRTAFCFLTCVFRHSFILFSILFADVKTKLIFVAVIFYIKNFFISFVLAVRSDCAPPFLMPRAHQNPPPRGCSRPDHCTPMPSRGAPSVCLASGSIRPHPDRPEWVAVPPLHPDAVPCSLCPS